MFNATIEQTFNRFAGLVTEADPASLPAFLSPAADNVDFETDQLRKRAGRTVYNAVAPSANAVYGGCWYYPNTGSPIPVIAAGSGIWADTNNDGDFGDAGEAIASGLTGGSWLDAIQWRDKLYLGNAVDALRKWTGSGSSAAVANLAAPAAAPDVSPYTVTAEACDSGTWTLTGSDIATSYPSVGGATILQVDIAAAAAEGDYIDKAWSAGATLDLSDAEFMAFLMYSANAGHTIQIGIKNNSGTINWSDYIKVASTDAAKWVRYDVPLAMIPPDERSASTGLAIRWVSKDPATAYAQTIYFENFKPQGFLEPDLYRVWYTYYDSTTGQESAPSAVAEVTLSSNLAIAGIAVGVTATGSADKVRIYRWRSGGAFSKARRVAEENDTAGTVYDVKSDGVLALENAAWMVPDVADPPIAKTYAVVRQRMIAGGVTVSGTYYPHRLYLSRYGYPEQFSSLASSALIDDDGTVAGFIDLGERDAIIRIVEFDGTAIIFCRRSIWSLEGSTWSDFVLRRRADVGLIARDAVVIIQDRIILFLASDGIRALQPGAGFAEEFPCWQVSESVNTIPGTLDSVYAGVDERGRVHFTYGSANSAYIFDPRIPGALDRAPNPERPGWTYYSNWGFTSLWSARRGTAGSVLFGGDYSTGKMHRLQMAAEARIESDDGADVAWAWMSPPVEGPANQRIAAVAAETRWRAANSETITTKLIVDQDTSHTGNTTSSVALPASSSGVKRQITRAVPGTIGITVSVRLSGSNGSGGRIIELRSAQLFATAKA